MNRLLLLLILIPYYLISQAPEKFSFQAVVYDNQSNLIRNKNIGIRMSILSGDINGTIVYQETHNAMTNSNGLFTIEIGNGTPTVGTFSEINWGAATHFLRREFDLAGGTNYIITGVGQMMSVPYSLHSKTAEMLYPDIFIGKDTFGGIVFHIERYPDKITGLVVAKVETTAIWSHSLVEVGADSFTDGQYNTNKMIDSPAKDYVKGLREGGFDDWYLPSWKEMHQLNYNIIHINNSLIINSHPSFYFGYEDFNRYWTSTEMPNEFNRANCQDFITNSWGSFNKNSLLKIRAIRKFEISLP